MWWWRCCLIILCKFSVPETQSFSAILQLWPLKSLWPLKLSFSRALGWYRHMSSSRQFRNILCWLEIHNYYPDGGNWNLAFVLFPLLFIFLWTRKPWLGNVMFIIMLACSFWIWMGIYFRYILLIRISRETSNYVQHVFEKKNIYFIIFPPILYSYIHMCVCAHVCVYILVVGRYRR